jgi:hypothetical protein
MMHALMRGPVVPEPMPSRATVHRILDGESNNLVVDVGGPSASFCAPYLTPTEAWASLGALMT